MKFGNWAKIIVLFGLLAAGGCEPPAQLHWSPDGKKAVWWKPDRHGLIDENGTILHQFEGASTGGFAWSKDSAVLYHAMVVQDEMTLLADQDGKSTPLVSMKDHHVYYMILSPDQNWLAMVTQREDQNKTFELFAYSIQSGTLFPLATSCGLGICFTGPSRLAWLLPAREESNLDSLLGTLVETNLDESLPEFAQATLADVVPAATPWLQAMGEDILFTAAPKVLPGRPDDEETFSLYYFSRADGSITAIAEEVGPLFAPSPDGKRILFEQKTLSEEAPARSEIAIMNANGSNVHVLRDVTESGFPLWPAWRGNGEFAFTGPMEEAKPATDEEKSPLLFDLILYQISPENSLEPVRTLSQQWDDEWKPSKKRDWGVKPASQPATDAIQ